MSLSSLNRPLRPCSSSSVTDGSARPPSKSPPRNARRGSASRRSALSRAHDPAPIPLATAASLAGQYACCRRWPPARTTVCAPSRPGTVASTTPPPCLAISSVAARRSEACTPATPAALRSTTSPTASLPLTRTPVTPAPATLPSGMLHSCRLIRRCVVRWSQHAGHWQWSRSHSAWKRAATPSAHWRRTTPSSPVSSAPVTAGVGVAAADVCVALCGAGVDVARERRTTGAP
mmetsp:Transcript_15210/g.52845  ORF Transcript_15210/g.52845 Transcript_15210/m.52845 type:complete len:233 (+) Transcript_15210:849-1547(+)